MADLPFVVYFDYEATTGDNVFNNNKNVCIVKLSQFKSR